MAEPTIEYAQAIDNMIGITCGNYEFDNMEETTSVKEKEITKEDVENITKPVFSQLGDKSDTFKHAIDVSFLSFKPTTTTFSVTQTDHCGRTSPVNPILSI